jgi:hypothetical protein
LKTKMARPHHRKGHKEHLKQFQNRAAGNTGESKAKAKASSVFAVGGAVVGMAILYLPHKVILCGHLEALLLVLELVI